MFSCEFSDVSKNTFSYKTLPVAATLTITLIIIFDVDAYADVSKWRLRLHGFHFFWFLQKNPVSHIHYISFIARRFGRKTSAHLQAVR